MLHAPRRALAAAVLLLALSQLALPDPTPTPAHLDDLDRHEGRTVLLHGVLQDTRDGPALSWDGHAVRLHAADLPEPGRPLEVEGRLARLGPDLVLLADAMRPWTP